MSSDDAPLGCCALFPFFRKGREDVGLKKKQKTDFDGKPRSAENSIEYHAARQKALIEKYKDVYIGNPQFTKILEQAQTPGEVEPREMMEAMIRLQERLGPGLQNALFDYFLNESALEGVLQVFISPPLVDINGPEIERHRYQFVVLQLLKEGPRDIRMAILDSEKCINLLLSTLDQTSNMPDGTYRKDPILIRSAASAIVLLLKEGPEKVIEYMSQRPNYIEKMSAVLEFASVAGLIVQLIANYHYNFDPHNSLRSLRLGTSNVAAIPLLHGAAPFTLFTDIFIKSCSSDSFGQMEQQTAQNAMTVLTGIGKEVDYLTRSKFVSPLMKDEQVQEGVEQLNIWQNHGHMFKLLDFAIEKATEGTCTSPLEWVTQSFCTFVLLCESTEEPNSVDFQKQLAKRIPELIGILKVGNEEQLGSHRKALLSLLSACYKKAQKSILEELVKSEAAKVLLDIFFSRVNNNIFHIGIFECIQNALSRRMKALTEAWIVGVNLLEVIMTNWCFMADSERRCNMGVLISLAKFINSDKKNAYVKAADPETQEKWKAFSSSELAKTLVPQMKPIGGRRPEKPRQRDKDAEAAALFSKSRQHSF